MARSTSIRYSKKEYKSEFDALKNAISRCTRPAHPQYKDYGGRNIFVAPEFMGPVGFDNFMDEVGPKPSPELTLDRLNNSLGYQRGNLSWTSRTTQQMTTRPKCAHIRDLGWGFGYYDVPHKSEGFRKQASPLLAFNGEIKMLKDWSDELGIRPNTIRQRFYRGWPMEAVLAPVLFFPRHGYTPDALNRSTRNSK